ncbi:MAG: S41 family peptidase [Ilumatobacteraceae bacterium]
MASCIAAGCGSDGIELRSGTLPDAPSITVGTDAGSVSVSVSVDDDTRVALAPIVDGILQLPDGWFEMAGYGTVLHADGDEITLHYVTSSTCVVGDHVDNELPVDHAGLDAGGVIVADLVGPTTDYRLLPLTGGFDCDSRPAESVTALDEVFRAHYPFFGERGVDWSDSVAAIRTATAADPSAFEPALAEFMAELADGHTTLDWLSIDPPLEKFGMPELASIDDAAAAMRTELDATLARVDGLRVDPTGSVGWGMLDDSIGYLLLAGFDEVSGEDDPVANRAAFADAMNAAVADLAPRSDRIVVDVRFNEGGEEDLAVRAAGYFVEEPTPAYRKWAYGQPDPFVQVVEVDPQPVRFTGDVVVLTSPVTASAAEVFALAMTEVADATVIGNPSFGEFSDAIDWVLPNGVEFTMSMEVYTDLSGTNHETNGVPVEIVTRFDEGLDAAVVHLR